MPVCFDYKLGMKLWSHIHLHANNYTNWSGQDPST